MFWKVRLEERRDELSEDRDAAEKEETGCDGRYVLHRHRDAQGEHLDLRIEQDGYLLGWRIAGASLEASPWATEKQPHPLRWLEDDGDAVREDSGVYTWVERGAEQRILELHGQRGTRVLWLEREEAVSLQALRSLHEALGACGAEVEDAGALLRDGVAARARAATRLCSLGRELDGGAFEEAVWRKTLERLSLEEIHGQLRAFEVRFDEKYPPIPVSKPQKLAEAETGDRAEAAMAILRG